MNPADLEEVQARTEAQGHREAKGCVCCRVGDYRPLRWDRGSGIMQPLAGRLNERPWAPGTDG
jgi:hypothetical protein